MITPRDILAGFLLPMLVTAGVLVIGWRASRHHLTARDSRSSFGPLAVAAGFVLGWLALFGRPPFPPVDVYDWLPYLAIGVGLLAAVDSLWDVPLPARIAAAMVCSPLAAWLLLRPLLASGFATVPAFLTCSLLGVVWIVAMDLLARKISAVRVSMLLLLTVGPGSLALMMAVSQRVGQFGGLLTATQAGVALAPLLFGSAGIARGVMLLCGILFGGILLCGHYYSDFPVVDSLLVFAAPVLAWLVQRWEHRWGAARTALAQWGLALVPVGIVLGRAIHTLVTSEPLPY